MRGSIAIELILDIIQAHAEAGIMLADILTSNYAESRRKAWRYANRPRFSKRWSELYHDKQKFYALLNHLKTQGLVEPEKRNKKSVWRITKKGKEKLAILRERNLYSKDGADYKPEKDDSVKIITYDVPASENKKRWWLRWALLEMGFSMIQRSVWIGKKKIPEEFISDLKERRMLPYVQILEVRKSGTLKELA